MGAPARGSSGMRGGGTTAASFDVPGSLGSWTLRRGSFWRNGCSAGKLKPCTVKRLRASTRCDDAPRPLPEDFLARQLDTLLRKLQHLPDYPELLRNSVPLAAAMRVRLQEAWAYYPLPLPLQQRGCCGHGRLRQGGPREVDVRSTAIARLGELSGPSIGSLITEVNTALRIAV